MHTLVLANEVTRQITISVVPLPVISSPQLYTKCTGRCWFIWSPVAISAKTVQGMHLIQEYNILFYGETKPLT